MAYQREYQYDIFEAVFQYPLHPRHELILLGNRIDWDNIQDRLSTYYSSMGRQAKDIRLMVGLHILKHRFNLSDEKVVKGLHENVYWMSFCGVSLKPRYRINERGEKQFIPCEFLEASSMTKFRKGIGPEGMRIVEEVIRERLISEDKICPRTQLIDTTCMEKNIAYPTGLLDKGRRILIKTISNIKNYGVKVPSHLRSFKRVSKGIIIEINKWGKGRKENIESGAKRLITYAHHIVRQVPKIIHTTEHKIKRYIRKGRDKEKMALERLKHKLNEQTKLVERVIHQTIERFKGNHIAHKILSLHEPEVVCIRKGKRKRPHEYGSKVLISIDRHGYIVDHKEYASNPCDSNLLEAACQGWENSVGSPAKEIGADRAFHRNQDVKTPHVSKVKRVSIHTKGKGPHTQANTSWFKRLQRLRAKIEPVISHLKNEHRMDRSRYKGFEGDQINVSLAVIAWNTKKWNKTMVSMT